MEQAADAILQAAGERASLNELSDDGDGSSSLSEIEYKDSHQEEEGEASEDHSDDSDEGNDSEAETERLEESPNKIRTHKDVVLNAHNDSQIYERSPSKLHNQIIPADLEEEDDEEPLSEEDVSLNESPRSSGHDDVDPEPPTAATSLEDSAGESKRTLSINDADSRKRKRSIMAGSGLDDDIEEPLRKRTGSIMTPRDDYAIEDDDHPDEEVVTSNPISGNISGEERDEDEVAGEIEEPMVPEEEAPETVETPVSPKRRGRKKKKVIENGTSNQDEDPEALPEGDAIPNGDEVRNGEEDNVENEGDDEAEAALKNEEERRLRPCFHIYALLNRTVVERKRIALDQLTSIEKQFTTFRDRLVVHYNI